MRMRGLPLNDETSIVSIKSIEFEFDGVRHSPTVCFEVSQTNGECVILSEVVKPEPAETVFESYDEIVRRARMQLRNRFNEMMLDVDAQLQRSTPRG